MTTHSLPCPPFYTIPHIANLRDPSLHPNLTTSSGAKLRLGILFRSAEPSKLDQEGWRQIRALGIGHVFDLRSKPEVNRGWIATVGNGNGNAAGVDESMNAQPAWIGKLEKEGLNRHWVPVFADRDYSPERLAQRYAMYMGETAEGFVRAYADILMHAGPSFRTILLYLAGLPPPGSSSPGEHTGESEAELGALVHCTAGKDRTGIFFGLLFTFLGVDRETAADEYALTELGLAHVRDEVVGRLVQSQAVRQYVALQMQGKEAASAAELADGGGDGAKKVDDEALVLARRAALRMAGARRENLLGSLEMVEREYGGAEGYFRGVCGLGDEELEALRRNLVLA
ncbi:tyrosine phosphatase family-domain-containing protein [Massariosphaeria phaeospora]|uniref:Tyrosine phosphatase family-domain-containing protein n=1 Tax=Massariosphaeria phaeospora TaxID=100035 RepID=A0A7C8I4R8_9PLEO|nr:tyrosine phosphatase family-domain-containing protein [Massariosphaeria phaeospora]